jgi:hypothetical protein
MFLLSSGTFEREIIEVERCDHLLARLLAYLLQFIAENYEFATHKLLINGVARDRCDAGLQHYLRPPIHWEPCGTLGSHSPGFA